MSPRARAHAKRPTLFIAVSSGQNVSNAIPLLTLMETKDHLLLLESDTAVRQQWSRGLITVLKKYGRKHIHRVSIREDGLLQPGLVRRFPPGITDDMPVTFCLNGGQKTTAASIVAVLQYRITRYVYLSPRPVKLLVMDANPYGDAVTMPIRRPLTLDDVLEIKESTYQEGGQGVVAFTSRKGVLVKPRPELELFYTDKKFIRAVYRLYLNRDIPKPFVFKGHKEEIMAFLSETWERTPLKNLAFSSFTMKMNTEEKDRRRKEWLASYILQVMRHLSRTQENKTIQQNQLAPEDRHLLWNAGLLQTTGDNPFNPGERFGTYFEKAVWHRLNSFLVNHPAVTEIVTEIRLNVKLARKSQPEKVAGEHDILIVLKNGILISLECKTHTFETKEIFARLARLTNRTGNLAQLWVTAPLFTHETLYRDYMGELEEKVRELNIPFIPFNMENQPPGYPGPEGEQPVPTFEQALARQFNGFLPQRIRKG